MFKDKAKACLGAFDYLVGAWLFGSQATGRTHASSDVDIAILGKEALTLEQRLELQASLEVGSGGCC